MDRVADRLQGDGQGWRLSDGRSRSRVGWKRSDRGRAWSLLGCLAGGLVGLLLVTSPAAVAAVAAPALPGPVTVPSSVLGELGTVDSSTLGGMAQSDANAYLVRTVGTWSVPATETGVTTTAAAGEGAIGEAGVAAGAGAGTGLAGLGVAGAGLALGYGIGTFGVNVACSTFGKCLTPVAGYSINSDATTGFSWPFSSLTTAINDSDHPGTTMQWAVADPQISTDRTSMSITATPSGTIGQYGSTSLSGMVGCAFPDGSGASGFTLGWQVRGSAPTTVMGTFQGTCPTGILRHISFLSPQPANVEVDIPAAAAPSDPERFFRSDGSCVVAGGTASTVSADSGIFHESDSAWPTFPKVVCPAGGQLQHIIVHEYGGATTRTVFEWTAPAGWDAIPGNYPNCVGSRCLLRLHHVDANGNRIDCFANPDVCANWGTAADPTTNYVCTFGVYDVPVAECNVYKPTFKHVVEVNAQAANPSAPEPSAPPYGPPSGEPAPGPAPTPAPDTGCPPSFGLDLLTPWWLFKGMTCALEYAFVPSTSALDGVKAEATDITTRVPFSYVADVVGWVGGLAPAGGAAAHCLDLSIGFPAASHLPTHVEVLNSCDDANPIVKFLHDNRPLLTVAVYASFVMPLAWWAWRQYAPGSQGSG